MTPTASEWCEAVVRAGVHGLGGPPHGSPERWDWGLVVKTLGRAMVRHEHLERVARNLSPEQLDEAWTEDSPEAAELRRVMKR